MIGIMSWPILFCLVVLGLDGILSSSTGCPSGWLRNGRSCWLVVHETLYMEQAQERCRQSGGNLAVPTSKAENDYLTGLFGATWPKPKVSLWLGCTVTSPGNSLNCFEKLDSSDSYHALNLLGDSPARCVILMQGTGAWVAIDCDVYQRHVICKLPARLFTARCSAVASPAEADGSSCLQGHTFSVLRAAGRRPEYCCLACSKNTLCLSFNMSGETCRLNNATKAQVDGAKHFEREQDCTYYEIKRA